MRYPSRAVMFWEFPQICGFSQNSCNNRLWGPLRRTVKFVKFLPVGKNLTNFVHCRLRHPLRGIKFYKFLPTGKNLQNFVHCLPRHPPPRDQVLQVSADLRFPIKR